MACDLKSNAILQKLMALAPELESVINGANGNARFALAYEMAVASISECAFGNNYNLALTFYIAHLLTLQGVVSAQGGMATVITQGGVQSEKEGDLQISYGSIATGKLGDDLLSKTYYGRLFLDLRRASIVPVYTRMG